MSQLATLESHLEKKLQQHIKKSPDEDAPMDTDVMETRLSQLEHQLQHVQRAQASTDAKVGQLQIHIEHQSQCLGEKIDQKMNEHMDRIEQLLSKRVRHE